MTAGCSGNCKERSGLACSLNKAVQLNCSIDKENHNVLRYLVTIVCFLHVKKMDNIARA